MNRIISVYELLGLIKDGKAPKFVRYDNCVWQFKEQFDDYFNGEEYLIGDGFDNWDNAKTYLNEKLEILEDKHKIHPIFLNEECGIEMIEAICDKLNEIIDYINRKKNNDKH